jgi:hypothetical protein
MAKADNPAHNSLRNELATSKVIIIRMKGERYPKTTALVPSV